MSLKQQAVTGVKWTGLSRIIAIVFTFITTAILSRILTPSDFGLLGMILVITGFAQAFADAGISNALIYHQDTTDEQLSSLYWVNIIAGVIIFLIILITDPLIVAYYQEPRISDYLCVLAIRFVIVAFGQQFKVLLQKELRFRTLSIIEIIALSVSSIAAVITALLGWGVWSLVLRSLIQAVMGSILLILWAAKSGRLPHFHFRRDDLKGYLSFGLFQMGEKSMNYLSSNVDSLIIGRFLGVEALGYYFLAFQLVKFPLSQINPVITRVAFPTFSKIKEDEVLRRGFLKVTGMISIIVFPLLAGMFLVAPVFVEIVYGSTWLPAITVIQILCVIGFIRSLGNPLGSLLLSRGRADIGFYWNVVVVMLMVVSSLIGVKWGIEGVALCSLIAFVFIRFPVSFYLLWFVVRMKVKPYLLAFVVPLVGSVIMVAVVMALRQSWTTYPQTLNLIFQISIGALVYILLTFILDRDSWIEIRNALLNRNH